MGLVASAAFGQIATPPVIDGDPSDAVWATAVPMDLLRGNVTSGVSDEADFSATVWALWDMDAIYILLQVMDDTLITDLNEAWERDHYSIYFDFGNHKSDGYLTDAVAPFDSVQFMLEKIWSVEGDLSLEDSSLVWGTDFVESIDSGSMYTLEMAIPMEDIGVMLASEMVIGFDAKVGDNDADGNLDGKYSLYQFMDEGWQNPSYLGTAKLEADGSFSRVKHMPVIDGMPDYSWYPASTFDLKVENVNEGIDDANDFSGTVTMMHDLENIYVYVNVKDDTLVTDQNEAWERDHYSVYFDFGNHKSTSYLEDMVAPFDSVQFMLEKIWSIEGDLAMEDTSLLWGVDFAEMIDSGSAYGLEIKIPLDLIGVTIAEGDIIGFDTKIGDNDADGSLDGKLSWHQRLDEGWQNPSFLGNVSVEPVFFDLGGFAWAPHQIVVDGIKDGNFSQAVPMPLERENVVDGITDANDFSGTISALWDTENIYLWLEVKDDTLITDQNEAWERDHYSIYFDFGNLKTETYVSDMVAPYDSVQFMLEKIWSVEGDLAMEDTSLIWGVDFVEMIDSGVGYALEMIIPLELIGVDLMDDMTIGFDAKIGDNDGDGSLDGKLSWNQFEDEGWQNPSYLGEVTLMANGTFEGMPFEKVSVMDIIAGSEDHTTLETAIEAAGLTETLGGEGPFTVFAPTDEAFAALPDGTLEVLLADPEGALTNILLYHVVGAKAMSGDLSDGQMIETLNGEEVTVTIMDGNVYINDAMVTVADLEADNGVVHVIDAVLMPTTTVVDIIVSSPLHNTLETAVLAAGLEDDLAGEGPFTVFAPVDAAFAALPDGVLDALLADPEGALTDVLLYHVVAARAMSGDLSDGQMIETMNGDTITVTITDGKVYINEAMVAVPDIPADNGVVHIIDQVLIPPSAVGTDQEAVMQFAIYPNPATSMFRVISDEEMETLSITGITGQLIRKVSVQGRNAEVNISDLENGMYVISVQSLTGEVSNRMLFKK